MIDARPFHFKHFSLFHHRSTMKVGTDAVLLGRWVEVSPTDAVLDIGTGCGIMPLMLAQKVRGKSMPLSWMLLRQMRLKSIFWLRNGATNCVCISWMCEILQQMKNTI